MATSWRDRLADGPLDRAFWLGDIDARLPALFRIGLAVILLVDHLTEIPIVTALYGHDGVWPRALGSGVLGHVSDPLLVAAWAGGCVALLALALGLFSRISAFVAYVFLVSIHTRNDAICSGGDYLAQMCVFFLIWLETGAAYSLDARWFGRGKPFVAAAPWRAMQVRLALLYTLTAVFKLAGVWLSGDGIYVSLQQLGFVRPLGAVLLEHPTLAKLMTWGVVATELSVGLLIMFPLDNRRARRYAAIGSTLVQLGICAMMRVGAFTWVMLWTCVLLWPERERAPVPASPAPPRRKVLLAGCVAVLVVTAWAGLHLPLPSAINRGRALVGLRQDFDLFGGNIPVARWQAHGTRADGSVIDLFDAVPGFRSEVAWRYSPFYKLTFADNADYPAIARWLCRAFDGPLQSIELAKDTRPSQLPGEDAPFVRVVMFRGPCP